MPTISTYKERAKSHKRTFISIGALAGGNLVGSILSVVGGILVARFVGPEVIGQFRLFTLPLMYLMFLHIGTFEGLYRQIPFYIGRDRPDYVEKVASSSGAWNLVVTVAVSSGFLIFAFWGLWHGNHIGAAGWLSQALACASIYYGGYLGATYRTMNNFVVLTRIQLIQAIIAFCCIFTVVLWGFYGLCLRAVIPALLGVWLYHWSRPLRMPLRFDFAVLKEVVKIGMPLCFWATLNTSLWMAAEYSLMLKFGGVKWIGLFAIAVTIREGISILPQSAYQVIMPRVVETYAREGGVRNVTQRSFQAAGILVFLMVIVVLVISVLLSYFIQYFIPKYIDGLPLMKVCLWFSVVQAASLPVSTLFASGSSWLYGRCILCGFIIFLLATWLLIPFVGDVIAIAVGSLIGRITRIIMAYYDIWKFAKR